MPHSTYYACSFHTNRGDVICANGKVVSRIRVEAQLLSVVRQEVFTPDAIAYLTDRVQEALKRLSRSAQSQPGSRQTLEQDLAQTLQEREYIKDAILRGLSGEITREMLEDIETRVRTLRSRLQVSSSAAPVAASVLPAAIERRRQGARQGSRTRPRAC